MLFLRKKMPNCSIFRILSILLWQHTASFENTFLLTLELWKESRNCAWNIILSSQNIMPVLLLSFSCLITGYLWLDLFSPLLKLLTGTKSGVPIPPTRAIALVFTTGSCKDHGDHAELRARVLSKFEQRCPSRKTSPKRDAASICVHWKDFRKSKVRITFKRLCLLKNRPC